MANTTPNFRAKEIPPNDTCNYFFKKHYCGEFSQTDYRSAPNYPYEEMVLFMKQVNSKFSYPYHFMCCLVPLLCFLLVVGMMVMTIDVEEKTLYISFLSVIVGMILYFALVTSKKDALKRFVELQNKVLKTRKVRWTVGPKVYYLHLCVNYPAGFNPQGGWDR